VLSEGAVIEHCISAPDGLYSLYRYKDEKELENFVLQKSAEIFGAKSVFFDVKQKVESKAKTRITDGLLLDLNESGSPKFWIVEVELSKHDLYKEVEPQIRGFLRALKEENTLSLVRDTIYDELKKNRSKLKLVRETSEEEDSYYFINKVLHSKAGVIIVIDSETPQIDEIMEEFSSTNKVRLIEFKTYRRANRFLHSFTPLAAFTEQRGEQPEISTDWNARLQWVRPEISSLVKELIGQIESSFPTAKHRPRYRWHVFYSAEDMKPSSAFAVLTMEQKKIHVRIGVDPKTFNDPEKRVKQYKGWFFREKGCTEMDAEVTTRDDIPYVLTLIRQSYNRKRQ